MNPCASITSGEERSRMKKNLKVLVEEERNENQERRFCNFICFSWKKWALKTIPTKESFKKDLRNVYLSGLSLYLPQIIKFVKS